MRISDLSPELLRYMTPGARGVTDQLCPWSRCWWQQGGGDKGDRCRYHMSRVIRSITLTGLNKQQMNLRMLLSDEFEHWIRSINSNEDTNTQIISDYAAVPGTDTVVTLAHNTLSAAREASNDSTGGQQQGSQCGNNHVQCCSVMRLCPSIICCCCHNDAMGSLNRQFCDSPILKGFTVCLIYTIWSLYYGKEKVDDICRF